MFMVIVLALIVSVALVATALKTFRVISFSGLAPSLWGRLVATEASATDARPGAMTVGRSQLLSFGTLAASLIIGGAFLLRVANLDGVPFGFFCDEASDALDAYAIVHTLHDQHGAFLPAYFQALGDYRGGFHIYWEALFIGIFGLSEFAGRLSSVVAGTLTVWWVYLFVSKMVNRPVALFSALLLATAPWLILMSRVGWDIISVPFDIALCLFFLYKGLEQAAWLPFAFIFTALGMYTYQPGRVFFPLFGIIWIALYAPELWRHRRASLIGLIGGGIVLIPTLLEVLDGTFFTRLSQLSGPGLSLSERVAQIANNYMVHFETDFLFGRPPAESEILRQYVAGFGVMYPLVVPFLVLGLLVPIAAKGPSSFRLTHVAPPLILTALLAVLHSISTVSPLSLVACGLVAAGLCGVAWYVERANRHYYLVGVLLALLIPAFTAWYGVPDGQFLFACGIISLGSLAVTLHHQRVDVFLLLCLLIYPVGTSIVSGPVSTRSIDGVIFFQIFIARGLFGAGQLLKRLAPRRVWRSYGSVLKTGSVAIVVAATAASTTVFMHAYFVDYPTYSSGFWGWQSGAAQIVAYFQAHSSDYTQEYLNANFNAPDELLRFYNTPDMGRCASCMITNVGDPNAIASQYNANTRQLWAAPPGDLAISTLARKPYRLVATIMYPGGETAFDLIETGPKVVATTMHTRMHT